MIWERAAFSLLTADESWQPEALGTAGRFQRVVPLKKLQTRSE